MTNSLIPASALSEFDGEPRIVDARVAESLGFVRPRDIRKLIERNLSEFERFGTCATAARVVKGTRGSTKVHEYWLNEGQALLAASLSNTTKAADVRFALISVFMAWRQGKIVDVSQHYRRPPAAAPKSEHSFQLAQGAQHGPVTVTAVVPYQLAHEYFVMFTNFNRVTF